MCIKKTEDFMDQEKKGFSLSSKIQKLVWS